MAQTISYRRPKWSKARSQTTSAPMATLTPFRGRNIMVKKRTPPPSSGITPKAKATRSSEKETPTVVFTQCPLILNGDNATMPDTTSNNEEVSTAEASFRDSVYSHSDDSSDDHYAKATNMMQITLECGIASICRLRKIFPSSFFQKQDVEGTTVSNFDVGLLEDVFTGCWEEEANDEVETMSPLTATQKTHNTTQFTQHNVTQRTRAMGSGEMKAATEALMLLRWIGKQGVNVIMKQKRLANVIFGIMVPKDSGEDELLEQYVFQFGRDVPTQPSDPALSQAQHAMSSLFQNLNGYSAGNTRLSQAIVPMMTQGTVGTYTQTSVTSQFECLQSQQTEQTEDRGLSKSYCSRQSSQHTSISQKYSQNAASFSQRSMLESMNQSIKASVKRHKGAHIPSERYLVLRVEFTESFALKELPDVLRNSNSVSPKPQTKGMIVTPLGIVSEENYTGLSVAMTAYSKSTGDNGNNDIDASEKNSQSRLMVDESIVDEERFKPFTQMDNEEDASSKSFQMDDISIDKTKNCQSKAFRKPKSADEALVSNKKMRCISPLPRNHYAPGTQAFGIPSYGDEGSLLYLKCIIRDHRQSPEQYKVEYASNALKRKRQWIPANKVVSATEMRKQVESALKSIVCDDEEELIEIVAGNLNVSAALVGAILSKI